MSVQHSKDNPGWIGLGVPPARRLIGQRLRQEMSAIRHGRLSVAKNLAMATSADVWNFFIRQSELARAECPLCGWTGPAFLAAWNWRSTTFQSRCPGCDSRSRHRGLVKILRDVLTSKPEGPILCFAPEAIMLHEIARQDPQAEVVTTDLNSVDTDYPGEDIQHLSFRDASYAMILCNHVLEHVPEDVKGVAECARVLKPGGIAVFTVPGDFDKAATQQFEKPDDNGHYRHYGMDLLQVFAASFDRVSAIDMSEGANESWHVRAFDYSFVCHKFGEKAWA